MATECPQSDVRVAGATGLKWVRCTGENAGAHLGRASDTPRGSSSAHLSLKERVYPFFPSLSADVHPAISPAHLTPPEPSRWGDCRGQMRAPLPPPPLRCARDSFSPAGRPCQPTTRGTTTMTTTTTRSPSACRPARSRDAARPAPAGCRHRVRLVDDERPIARREPARRSSVPMRSQTKVSNVQPSEQFLLFRHDPARRTTFACKAARAVKRAEGRAGAVKPSAGVLGSSGR
jgi:hypothetical protein